MDTGGQSVFHTAMGSLTLSSSKSATKREDEEAPRLHGCLAEPSNAGGMMKPRIWSATCASIALGTAIIVLAQDPSPRTPPSSQTSQSQRASAKPITVTGCVQRPQQGPTGTTGIRETTPETKFVLTNAALGPAGTAGTFGTTAATP